MIKKDEVKLWQRDKEALEKVKLLMESVPQPAPTIKELCRMSGLNADKLKKGFKQLYGKPPFRYLLYVKIEKAKKMLSETELHVNEIAWELGYEYGSNFCIQFRKKTGKNPGQYRKDIKEEIHGKLLPWVASQ